MKFLGHVDSEGGPLLIADAQNARSWLGTEGNGLDYERCCQLFETDDVQGGPISIADGVGIIWDLQGAGTGHIYADGAGNFKIVRVWLNPTEQAVEEQAVLTLAELPLNGGIAIGSLGVTSGVLAILWAPESGECIESLDIGDYERPTGPMSTGSSALLIKVPNGRYRCLNDEVEIADGQSAVRCHLINYEYQDYQTRMSY